MGKLIQLTEKDPEYEIKQRKRLSEAEEQTLDFLVADAAEAQGLTLSNPELDAHTTNLRDYALVQGLIAKVQQYERELATAQDEVTIAKSELEKWKGLATVNDVSGLPNGRAYTSAWNRFYQGARRSFDRDQRNNATVGEHACVSYLSLDIDHFKKFNDTYGHDAGDAVLRHVGTILQNSVRDTDLAAHLHGEEFVVLLPGTNSKNAAVVAEKIRQRIETTPLEYEGQALNVTTSIGMYTMQISDLGERRNILKPAEALEEVAKKADNALYFAKDAGRNVVRVYK